MLLERGYADAEITGVARGYELAARLFTSRFRGSGKPFLAHAVGTAGILGLLRARAPVLIAGLLHAAYTHGDFGTDRVGMADWKRARLARSIGREVETLVARYTRRPWDEPTVRALLGTVTSLPLEEREVLCMRLANELEDHVDRGIGYCADAERRRQMIRSWLHLCVELAREVGEPALAAALDRTFRDNLASPPRSDLAASRRMSYTVAPASYRPSLLARLRRIMR